MLLGVLVVAFTAGGCGASSTEAGQVSTDTSSDFVLDYELIGASGPEEDLLSETIAKTRPPDLKSVELGPIPEDAVPSGANSETVPGTKWLTFEYEVDDEHGEVVEAFWRSAVAATGYRRTAEKEDLPLIRGYTIQSRTANGELVQNEVTTISSSMYEWDGKPPARDVEPLRARLSNESSPSVEVLSLEVAEPGGAAPIITLEASDPKALFEDRDTLRFVGDLGMYEGYLIRVVDPNGGLVWISASASRAGAGMGWTRPEFQHYVNG